MEIKKDCIYYYKDIEENTILHCCKYSNSFCYNNENICKKCRLWDAYIPKTATKEQIKYAQIWQNIPLNELPDYEEYFNY